MSFRKEFGIEGWHHASRDALLLGIDTYKLVAPTNESELTYLAALEYALTTANWQLVEYEKEPLKTER